MITHCIHFRARFYAISCNFMHLQIRKCCSSTQYNLVVFASNRALVSLILPLAELLFPALDCQHCCLTRMCSHFRLMTQEWETKRGIDGERAKQNGCLIKCRLLAANLLSPNAIFPGYVKAKQFNKCAVFDEERNVFFSYAEFWYGNQ